MSATPTAVMSHIGICTADLAKSLDFYTRALGFVHERSIDEIGPPFDQLTELPGVACKVHYVTCGPVRIELIGYPGSSVLGSRERRPMNQLGFTHMTLLVDDLDAALERVRAWGGEVHASTRIDSDYGPIVFCTDPNGVRIELMQSQAS